MLRGANATSTGTAGAFAINRGRSHYCTQVCFPRRFSKRNAAAFSPNVKPSGRREWRRGPAAGGRDDAEVERPDAHLVSRKELSDGTLIFSFGTEDDAKASQETQSDAAPAPIKDDEATAAAAHIEQEPAIIEEAEEEHFPEDDAANRLAQLAEDIDRIDDRIVEKSTKIKPAQGRKDPKPSEAQTEAELATPAKATKKQKSATKAKAAKAVSSPAPTPSADDLEALKVPELRAIAKERSLKGYSKLRKAELIELLTA